MDFNFSDDQLFSTKSGITFPGFTQSEVLRLQSELREEYGITDAQIAEAASYSMAMVVGYALGLSATGGKVGLLVSDCLEGWVCMAALRHLRNAGATGLVLEAGDSSEKSATYQLEKKPLEKMGIEFKPFANKADLAASQETIAQCHNLLCGLGSWADTNPLFPALSEMLNDMSTPIYVVGGPPGVDLKTGKPGPHALFASSTLSLGAPISTLNPAAENAGRHYLCDISIPAELYLTAGFDLTGLFAEQPVLQITAVKKEE